MAYSPIRFALADRSSTLVPDERLVELLGLRLRSTWHTLIPELRPRLAALGAAPVAPQLDAADQRGARMRESLIGVIGLATRSPFCLVIEDWSTAILARGNSSALLLRLQAADPAGPRHRLPHRRVAAIPHPALGLVREMTESRVVEQLRLESSEPRRGVRARRGRQGGEAHSRFRGGRHGGLARHPAGRHPASRCPPEARGPALVGPVRGDPSCTPRPTGPAASSHAPCPAAARRPLTASELRTVRLTDGHLPRNADAAALESGMAMATDGGLAIIHELCAEAIEQSLLAGERHGLHAVSWPRCRRWSLANRPGTGIAPAGGPRLAPRTSPPHTPPKKSSRAPRPSSITRARSSWRWRDDRRIVARRRGVSGPSIGRLSPRGDARGAGDHP